MLHFESREDVNSGTKTTEKATSTQYTKPHRQTVFFLLPPNVSCSNTNECVYVQMCAVCEGSALFLEDRGYAKG